MPAKRHAICRPSTKPSRGWKLYQLTVDNKWQADDGLPGFAFVMLNGTASSASRNSVAYVAECECKRFGNCPISAALDYAADEGAMATVVERIAPASWSLLPEKTTPKARAKGKKTKKSKK